MYRNWYIFKPLVCSALESQHMPRTTHGWYRSRPVVPRIQVGFKRNKKMQALSKKIRKYGGVAAKFSQVCAFTVSIWSADLPDWAPFGQTLLGKHFGINLRKTGSLLHSLYSTAAAAA